MNDANLKSKCGYMAPLPEKDLLDEEKFRKDVE